MRLARSMTMLCAALSLSACLRPSEQDGPLFRDTQRAPPPIAVETAALLVQTERDFAVWLVETNSNCISFGCVD